MTPLRLQSPSRLKETLHTFGRVRQEEYNFRAGEIYMTVSLKEEIDIETYDSVL